jgi:predicted nucleic acid-binding protein
MADRYNATDIAKLSGRAVLFDANVVIYIYWPTSPQSTYEKKYSRLFGALLKQGNKLYITTVVLSEVINRVMRIEYDRNNSAISFKQYRNSPDGQSVLLDMYTILDKKILTTFDVIDKPFTNTEIKSLLTVDSLDFNDKIITEICKTNSCLLITNDADYKDADIDILSINNKLLNSVTV